MVSTLANHPAVRSASHAQRTARAWWRRKPAARRIQCAPTGDPATNHAATISTAASQLCSPEPTNQLAGVYALAAAATEYAKHASNTAQRQRLSQCVDVLCSYLRGVRIPPVARAATGHPAGTGLATSPTSGAPARRGNLRMVTTNSHSPEALSPSQSIRHHVRSVQQVALDELFSMLAIADPQQTFVCDLRYANLAGLRLAPVDPASLADRVTFRLDGADLTDASCAPVVLAAAGKASLPAE